jgi:uncharacterized protein involved in outer membrane biogenesis
MRKILAVLGFSAGALLLFFAAAIFAFYHLIQVGELRRFLVSEFESRSGLKLDVGEAEVELGWVLGVSFRDFALRDPIRNIVVVEAPKIFIRVAVLPLLERKVVFHGVRLSGATAKIARDARGRVPWIDAVSNIPFGRVQDAGLSLDLRDLRIEAGELQFRDAFEVDEPVDTRATAIALAVHRARRLSLGKQQTGGGLPIELEIDLSTVVQQGERSGDVSIRGRAILGENQLDMRQADVDAYVSSTAFPVSLLWDVLKRPGQRGTPRGDLAYQAHWQGSWAHGVRVACEARFAHLVANARELFNEPVEFGDGRIDALADLKAGTLRFERFDMRSNRLSFSAQGAITGFSDGDPRVRFRANTPYLPVTVVRQYIPMGLLRSPRVESATEGLTRGEIRLSDIEVSGKLSELSRVFEPEQAERLSFHAEIRGAAGNFPGDRPVPLSGAGGEILLQHGVLQYKNLHGTLGRTRVIEVSGTQRQPFSAGPLAMSIKADADLAELTDRPEIWPAAFKKTIDSLHDIGGRVRLDLQLHADSASPIVYEGVATLDGARFRNGQLSLAQVRGDIYLSPKEIRAERAAAVLNGSDLRLSFLLKNFSAADGNFDLTVDSPGVKASDALGFLLPLDVSKTPGTVRGAIRYRGAFASPESRSLTGQLDLVGVEIPLPVFVAPFREVTGKVRLDGKTVDLEGLRGTVGGYALSLDGRWRGGDAPMLVFNAVSPDIDIHYILPRHVVPDEEWYDRLQVRGKLALDKAKYDHFTVSDLRTDLVLQKRAWRLERFSARADGGTVEGSATFTDRSEGGGFVVEPNIKSVPLQTILGWFGVESSEVTGKAQVAGKLEFDGRTTEERKRNLNGALRVRVEDGIMRRFQVAVRVLSFLDLSRWFSLKLPNINQEGIRFRSISADIRVARGVYSTKDFFLDGEDLKITGAGDLDGVKGELDFVVAVRPFPGLDHAANYIPVLGTGFAAIKNSLLVASFHVHGPMNDPSVTPAPFSTLTEFFYGALAIPKGLIGLPSTGAPKEQSASQ